MVKVLPDSTPDLIYAQPDVLIITLFCVTCWCLGAFAIYWFGQKSQNLFDDRKKIVTNELKYLLLF